MFQNFKHLKVLIIGDVMIDNYLSGTVNRISPEAPVPVVELQKTDARLGGAANVALNIHALGATPYLFSMIGADTEGVQFLDILTANNLPINGILQNTERITTTKTRIMAGNHQMLRLDREITADLTAAQEAQFLQDIRSFLDNQPIHVIILQDYNKGVLTLGIIEAILAEAQKRKIPTAADPKHKNFLAYKNATLFKPNLKEIKEAIPLLSIKPELDSLTAAADYLHQKLDNRYTMITLSEKGLFLNENIPHLKGVAHLGSSKIYSTHTRNIADVSGAGDTVISVAALCLAAQLDSETMAILSNLAGGQVCEVAGVVPVNLEQLEIEWAALKHIG